MRLERAPAALVAVSLAAGAWSACAEREQAPPRPAAVSGLSAALEHELRARRTVSWTTSWHPRWRPVPGAKDPLLKYITLEGTSREREVLREPHVRMSVASGIGRRDGSSPAARPSSRCRPRSSPAPGLSAVRRARRRTLRLPTARPAAAVAARPAGPMSRRRQTGDGNDVGVIAGGSDDTLPGLRCGAGAVRETV